MGTTSRFPFGITNTIKTETLGMFGIPDPTKFHTFFDDFDRYVAGDWTLTSIGTTGTAALADGDGGLLLLTDTAADNADSRSESVQPGHATDTLMPGTAKAGKGPPTARHQRRTRNSKRTLSIAVYFALRMYLMSIANAASVTAIPVNHPATAPKLSANAVPADATPAVISGSTAASEGSAMLVPRTAAILFSCFFMLEFPFRSELAL